MKYLKRVRSIKWMCSYLRLHKKNNSSGKLLIALCEISMRVIAPSGICRMLAFIRNLGLQCWTASSNQLTLKYIILLLLYEKQIFFPHNYLILPNVAELAIIKVPIYHYRIRRKYRTIRYILGWANRWPTLLIQRTVVVQTLFVDLKLRICVRLAS